MRNVDINLAEDLFYYVNDFMLEISSCGRANSELWDTLSSELRYHDIR